MEVEASALGMEVVGMEVVGMELQASVVGMELQASVVATEMADMEVEALAFRMEAADMEVEVSALNTEEEALSVEAMEEVSVVKCTTAPPALAQAMVIKHNCFHLNEIKYICYRFFWLIVNRCKRFP